MTLLPSIVQVTADCAGIKVSALISPARHEPLAHWRQAGMIHARNEGYTLQQIGDAFGKRDHGTVVHAKKKSDCPHIIPKVKAVKAACDKLPQVWESTTKPGFSTMWRRKEK